MKKILLALAMMAGILAAQAGDQIPMYVNLRPVQSYNGKYGYVNSVGTQIVRPVYDDARAFINGFALVQRGGKWGYLNSNGQKLTNCIYDSAMDFYNGYAIVKRKGKWGAIATTGAEVVPCKFDSKDDLTRLVIVYNAAGEVEDVQLNQ